MKRSGFQALLILLVGVAAAGTAAGQAEDLGGGKERTLGGHGFLPSLYVSEPWVATGFQNHTGGGVAVGLEVPFRDLAGNELFTLEGDLFFLSLGLGYQQKLGGRMALGARFAVNSRSGTNAQSLIAEGLDLDRSANLWFKYRVLRTSKSQFTTGLNWDYKKAFILTPREFALAILAGEGLDSAPLLNDVKSWTALLTLDYAYAFSSTWAVRASGKVGLYEVPFTRDVAKATHRLGVMLEMDLNPRVHVPLGFTLGRTQGFPTDDPNSGMSGTLLGLWYTGREAFVVGMEAGYMTLPIFGSDKKVDGMYGVFLVRYYF